MTWLAVGHNTQRATERIPATTPVRGAAPSAGTPENQDPIVHIVKDSKRRTVSSVTTERLRQLILTGQLSAGEPLRQDDLSARLGVSRTPLREAIIALEAEGLVVNHAHKGAVVHKPTAAELREIYEIRMLLEPHAAREAATRVTPEMLQSLEAIVDEMERTTGVWPLVQLNQKLRRSFYECAGKPRLAEMIRGLMARAEPYVTMLVGGQRHPFTHREFDQLLDAIRQADGEKAAEVTRAHLAMTVENVMPMFER